MTEYWTAERRQFWGQSIAALRHRHKRARRNRRVFGSLAVFYSWMILFNYAAGLSLQWITVPFNTVCGVWLYLQYRYWRGQERRFLECVNLSQRVYVETMDMCAFHLGELAWTLHEVKMAKMFDWGGPNGVKAKVCSYYWWFAWKWAKRVRIYLEWRLRALLAWKGRKDYLRTQCQTVRRQGHMKSYLVLPVLWVLLGLIYCGCRRAERWFDWISDWATEPVWRK